VRLRPLRGGFDAQVRAGLAPHLLQFEAVGDPAVPLGSEEAAGAAKRRNQPLPVEGPVTAEDDGGNPVLLRLRRVRVDEFLGVAVVGRGGGFVVKPRVEDEVRADLAVGDASVRARGFMARMASSVARATCSSMRSVLVTRTRSANSTWSTSRSDTVRSSSGVACRSASASARPEASRSRNCDA